MTSDAGHTTRQRIVRELAISGGLVFIGVAILPLAVYFVGRVMFGAYEGDGFGAFYGNLQSAFRNGAPSVWLLMLSPWLIGQLLRLTAWGARISGRPERRSPVDDRL